MQPIPTANPPHLGTKDHSVWTLFQTCAHHHPSSVALRSSSQTLTYAELQRSAENLSSWLAQSNITSGDRVAVLLSNPIHAIEHFLALARLGASYVPLDSTTHDALLWPILKIADVSAIVLDPDSPFPVPANIALIPLIPNDFQPTQPTPPAEHDSLHPLYLMFTSGSTGEPKGVVIPHAGVIRLAQNTTPFAIQPSDRVLQFSSRAFDASTFEIWGALLNGASLILAQTNFPIKNIGKLISEFQVTIAWFTSRLFDVLVDHQLDDLAPLKRILFGGEPHSFYHVERAFRNLPNTSLIHGYGPTENTTFSTLHLVTETDLTQGVIPIGKTIHESSTHLLDPLSLLPVPHSTHGTLFVGGAGLALGYTDAQLTKDRFLFHPQLAEWLYNTGDIVYENPDGQLVFVGRQDRQIKIRGHRLELDEVELAIKSHPKISGAIVLYNEVFQSNEIFAFYQTFDLSPIEKTDLVEFLSKKIPEFAIPSQFAFTHQMPLKSTGKVDTKLLITDFQLAHRQVHQNGLENPLVVLWKKLLNLHEITETTHFFEAGGDSLSAVNLLLQVDSLFQITLPNDFLANHPQFSDFARQLFQAKSSNGLFTFSDGPSPHIVFLVPWFQGNAYSYAQLARRLSTNGPIFSFNETNAHGQPISYKSIQELAAAYCLTIEIPPGTSVSLCGSSAGGAIALEIASQLEARGIPVHHVIMLDTPEPRFYQQSFALWPTLQKASQKFFNPQRLRSIPRRLQELWRSPRLKSPAPIQPSSSTQTAQNKQHQQERDQRDQRNKALVGGFSPKNPQKAAVYLLRATEQDLDPTWSRSPDYGWTSVIPNIQVITVPGGHVTMLELGQVESLAHHINLILSTIPHPTIATNQP